MNKHKDNRFSIQQRQSPSSVRPFKYSLRDFAVASNICENLIANILIQKAFRKLQPPQQKVNKYSQLNVSHINIKLTTPQIATNFPKQVNNQMKDDEDFTLKLKKPKSGIRFVKKQNIKNLIRSKHNEQQLQLNQTKDASGSSIHNHTELSIDIKQNIEQEDFGYFTNSPSFQNQSSSYLNISRPVQSKIQFKRDRSFNKYANQFVNLEANIIQQQEMDDQMIQKFRQRKQKFYGRNGESTDMSKRQVFNHHQNIKNQNYAKLQKNTGFIPFDYTGQILPPIKHDTLKLAPHYQQMQCSITQIVEPVKKKQRMGQMYRAAINLKILDPQTYMFSSGKHDNLIFKQGIQMKQNASFMLKEGVQIRNKQNSNSCFFNYQVNRNSRPNYDFLLNNNIKPSKVKYADFVKYKKNGGKSTSKISSRKRYANDSMYEQGSPSKKSIALKNKTKQQNSKIVKGQNIKALDFLINNQNEFQDAVKKTQKSPSIRNQIMSQHLRNHMLESQKPKKKVRIL